MSLVSHCVDTFIMDQKISELIDKTLRADRGIVDFRKIVNSDAKLDPAEVLHKICNADTIKEEKRCLFAKTLLYKYSPDERHTVTMAYPIHLVAKKGHYMLLAELLHHPDHPANPHALTGHGETAIHSAVRGAAERKSICDDLEYSEHMAYKCIQVLLEKNCDPHVRDNISDKFTAVHLAAKHKLWKIVDLLLSQNVNVEIAIGGDMARDLIKVIYPEWMECYEGCSDKDQDCRDSLVSALESSVKSVDEKEQFFNNWLESNALNLNVNEPFKGRYTLLECAIRNTLPEVTRCLIKKKADPNPAIFTALAAGEKYFDLLKTSETKLNLTKIVQGKCMHTVLHKAVLAKSPSVNIVQYLLEEGELGMNFFPEWVNARDYKGWTALHYAAKRHLSDVVAILLQFKANMFISDSFGQPAFLHLRPEQIEEHLNEQVRLTDASLMDDDYGVIFDFNVLAIPRSLDGPDDSRSKTNKDVHVTVTSDEKSEEITYYPEVEPLRIMADSPNHKHLLQHPLIRAFLRLKWHRLYWFYWLNCGFFLFFTLSFFLFVLSIDFKSINGAGEIIHDEDNSSNKSIPSDGFLYKHHYLFWAVTWLLTGLLALREILQLTFLTKNYIYKLENWMEMALIALTFWLLTSPLNKALASFLALLVSMEMVHLMSRHPRLSTYINMFIQVARNFIKFLLWYFFLIVAFGLSFYIIFPMCRGEECKSFFNTIPYSIFKTIVMISGEYESGDLEFDHVSIASHVIFIAFLFFISIVMVNLLNGLAVSDTQQIKNEAETIFCVSQAKFFAEIETTLLVSCGSEKSCPSFCRSFARTMGEKILLLDNLLAEHDNKITVYLNKQNEVKPNLTFCVDDNCCCGWMALPYCLRKICSSFNSIVSDALQVANKSNEFDRIDQILASLIRLEKLYESEKSFVKVA
ncbi:Hypothetical predicted protein [Cloeon dipterum]|uniref:Ion transport domain-containing protein n=1 Tax=Cloeon dipterum TaxID=197152 RepID=A0A8S1C2F8_9INSE|nr:Hypothetical predicted protein [Cloeon dipterum]